MGHDPSEIGPGTFNTEGSTNANWNFPGNVEIGAMPPTNPEAKLQVIEGTSTWSALGLLPLAYFGTQTENQIAVIADASPTSSPLFPNESIGILAHADDYAIYTIGGKNSFNNEVIINGDLNVTDYHKIYGWNVPSHVRQTSGEHNANFGGPKGMYDWIQTSGCNGYHVCSSEEILAYLQVNGHESLPNRYYGWIMEDFHSCDGGADGIPWISTDSGDTGATFLYNYDQPALNGPVKIKHKPCNNIHHVYCCK